MSPEKITDEEKSQRSQSLVTSAFIRVAQNVGIIVATLSLVIAPFWAFGVNQPLQQLQSRVDKIEGRLDSVQVSNQSIDKNVAVMAEKLTNMEQIMKQFYKNPK